jgi:hypothetical protein
LRLIPKLSQCADRLLLYVLLYVLCRRNGNLALQRAESLPRRLLAATLPGLHLKLGDLEPTKQQPTRRSDGGASDRPAGFTTVIGFEDLLEICFTCGLHRQAMELLRNTHESVVVAILRMPPKSSEPENAQGLRQYGVPNRTGILPAERFLASLVTMMQRHSVVDLPPFLRDLFLLLFTRYILPDQPKSTAEMRLYEQRLLVFRQPVVQRLLGDETYQSMIMLGCARATPAAHVPAKRAAEESQGQPASTRQRTKEVIDLTGD